MSQAQFSLSTLMGIVTGCCCAAAAVRVVGFTPLLFVIVVTLGVCLLISPLVLIWCVFNYYMPAFTKNSTALFFVVFFVGSVLVCGIQQAQVHSRRNLCGRNLMELGKNLQVQQQLSPETNALGSTGDQRWIESYSTNFVADSLIGDSRNATERVPYSSP